MFKRYLRWIAPLVVLFVLTTYLAMATLISTHAASLTVHVQSPTHVIIHQHHVKLQDGNATPSIIRRGF